MNLKNVFLALFALISLMFEGYFGVISVVSFILQIILIAVVVVSIGILFRKKTLVPFPKRVLTISLVSMAIIGIFQAIFLAFIGYHNAFPGKLSDITISNGKQEVIFLQMSHIATESFYKQKEQTISVLSESGYVFLMEGVRPGTKENEKLFSDSLGFQFTPTLYGNIASYIGLESQNNQTLFARTRSGSVISVDVSIDDIMTIMGTGSATVSGESQIPVDIEAELHSMGQISSREKAFISYVARAVMNFTLKQSGNIEDILSLDSHPKLFEAILGKRNQGIVEYIQKHPEESIVVVYGGLHFEGVFSALQKSDPTWSIKKIVSHTPYNP